MFPQSVSRLPCNSVNALVSIVFFFFVKFITINIHHIVRNTLISFKFIYFAKAMPYSTNILSLKYCIVYMFEFSSAYTYVSKWVYVCL